MKQHSGPQIVVKLREADVGLGKGLTVPEVCKKIGVSEQTYYRWRQNYGGMSPSARTGAEGPAEGECPPEAAGGRSGVGQCDSEGSGGVPGKLTDPVGRRKVIEHVRGRLGCSERRVYRVLGQAPSSQRYQLKDDADERQLIERMKALAATRQRYGQDRITVLLRKSGVGVNHKRVERLWRQEGLQVPRKPRKRRRLSTIDHSSERVKAQYRNHVWSYDFVADKTEDGRRLKFLTVEDEYTRESLTLEVERRMTAPDVKEILEYLFLVRGRPKYLRSDNGPEFIGQEIQRWLDRAAVGTLYINKASPWENGYASWCTSLVGFGMTLAA
jgi:transposase